MPFLWHVIFSFSPLYKKLNTDSRTFETVKHRQKKKNIHTCELINSLYFISSNGLPGIEMEFTSRLCLIGSATLGLILLVWGVFELDYSIVGLGYCFSGFDKMVYGGL